MAGLHVQQIREVHREPGLGDAFDKAVRETVGAQALEGAHAVAPALGQCDAVAADQLEAGAAAVVGAHLETRREDQTVELVGHPVDDDAGLGDALHAAAAGVDQRDVVPVERLQIFVVEAGPLAEIAVPGFERLGGGAIGHDLVDPRPDLLHLGEVRQSRCRGVRCSGSDRTVAVVTHDRKLAGDARPGVGDQVFVRLSAGREDLEVLYPLPLPAGL